MKYCPICTTDYVDTRERCPQDGARLIDKEEWAPGTVIRNKYRILSCIGRGGMGIVYKAEHLVFKDLWALKVMSPRLSQEAEFVRRFYVEAERQRKLKHRNVVRVDDVDQAEDGRLFIGMEFVDGMPMREMLHAAQGPLAVPLALAIARGMAEALEAADALGIVHRDIKPDNVLLERGPGGQFIPKLTDFGVAKMREGTATMSKTPLLTPQYAAPEQWQPDPDHPVDGRTDLYALGMTMYEMLTGRSPFNVSVDREWMYAHLNRIPEPPSHFNPALEADPRLDDLVLRLLEKDPAHRPASAREVIQQLALIEASPVRAATPAWGEATVAMPQRTMPSPPRRTPAPSPGTTPPAATPARRPGTTPPPATPARRPGTTPPARPPTAPPARRVPSRHREEVAPPVPAWVEPEAAPEAEIETSDEEYSAPPSRIGLWVTLVVVLALAGGGGYYYYWLQSRPAAPPAATAEAVSAPTPTPTVPATAAKSAPLTTPEPTVAEPPAPAGPPSEAFAHTLSGHSGAVLSVAFSPRGRWLASGSEDFTLRLWDYASGALSRTIALNESDVASVAFSPSGRQIAAANWAQVIDLVDVASGQSTAQLTGHSDSINSLAYSPNGAHLVSGSEDRTVRVWDVASHASQVLRGHNSAVRTVAYSPNGSTIASGDDGGELILWNMANGGSQTSLSGHSGSVQAVAFDPRGNWFVSGSQDASARLCNLSGQSGRVLLSGKGSVQSVAFSPDGHWLAVGTAENTVHLFDTTSWEEVTALSAGGGGVRSVAFSDDGHILAAGCGDHSIHVWRRRHA